MFVNRDNLLLLSDKDHLAWTDNHIFITTIIYKLALFKSKLS